MAAIVNSQQQDGVTHRNYGWLTLLLGTVVTMLISLYISGVDDATTIPTSASKLSLWYSHMSVIAVGFLAGSVAFDSAFRQGVAMAAVALWFLICVVERMMKPLYGHVLIALYVSILCGFFMKRDKNVYKYSMPLVIKVSLLFACLVGFRFAFRGGRAIQRERLSSGNAQMQYTSACERQKAIDKVKEEQWKTVSTIVVMYLVHVLVVCLTTFVMPSAATSEKMDNYVLFVDTTIALAIVTHILPDAMRLLTANNKYVCLYSKEMMKLLPMAAGLLVITFVMGSAMRIAATKRAE